MHSVRGGLSFLSVLVFYVGVLSCSGGTSAATCVKGASAACACPDGRAGAQTCSDDGSFGACVCTGAGADGGTSAAVGSKLDILFAVDNSPGTGPLQQMLADALPVLFQQLPPGLDLHVGVVSSDLFVMTDPSTRCGSNDVPRLLAKDGCGLPAGEAHFLSQGADGVKNFKGELSTVASCLVGLGQSGCGLESQLASAVRSLGLPENAGFLRSDAALFLFILTDEDDCSLPPGSRLFDDPAVMTPAWMRCVQEGHVCQGQPLPLTPPLSLPIAACGARPDGRLVPIPELVAAVKAMKPSPERLLVAGRIPWPDGVYNLNYQTVTPVGFRLKAFIDSFGANGLVNVATMAELGTKVRRFLETGHP